MKSQRLSEIKIVRFVSTIFIFLNISAVATAESVTGSLQIEAGLVAGLTLTCEKPLTFGVWFVQSADREGGATRLSIGTNVPGALPSLNTVSGFGTSVLPGPGQGECTVSGSVAPDDTQLTVSFSDSSITLGSAEVLGQGAADTAAAMTVENFTFRPAAFGPGFPVAGDNPRISDGRAAFSVGADLLIPNNLESENFGGYSGTVSITVTEIE